MPDHLPIYRQLNAFLRAEFYCCHVSIRTFTHFFVRDGLAGCTDDTFDIFITRHMICTPTNSTILSNDGHCALRTPQEIVGAWRDGIDRLTERGVTGRILLANLPSPRGFPVSVKNLRCVHPAADSDTKAFANRWVDPRCWSCLSTYGRVRHSRSQSLFMHFGMRCFEQGF